MKQLKDVTVKVSGMTCGHCAKSVEAAARDVPGVEQVNVDLKGGTARVSYESNATNIATIVAAIVDAGFETTAD